MTAARLPAHLEVAAIRRLAEGQGGTAMVLSKGDADSGAILLVTVQKGENARLWERLPALDGSRDFAVAKVQGVENSKDFDEYVARRAIRDPDSWVIELDIPDAERFIADLAG